MYLMMTEVLWRVGINDWQSIMEKKQEFNLFYKIITLNPLLEYWGLHYQLNPYAQGKLVRCISGEIST